MRTTSHHSPLTGFHRIPSSLASQNTYRNQKRCIFQDQHRARMATMQWTCRPKLAQNACTVEAFDSSIYRRLLHRCHATDRFDLRAAVPMHRSFSMYRHLDPDLPLSSSTPNKHCVFDYSAHREILTPVFSENIIESITPGLIVMLSARTTFATYLQLSRRH